MKIAESSLKGLQETGVYKITNLCNSKVYIGSTRKSFVSRYSSHYEKLRTNNHRGYPHLQNAVNKYGIENFEFEIVEACDKEKCIERETYWIKQYDACDRGKGYNMNDQPFLSPFANKEIRAKAAETVKARYKSREILPNSGTFKKGIEPWNKGKKYQSTEHLKVPKKKKADRTKVSETWKEKQKWIRIFTIDGILLVTLPCWQDVQQHAEFIAWRMVLKNKEGRNGHPCYYLSAFNIQKACRTGKPYKGLYFRYTDFPYLRSTSDEPMNMLTISSLETLLNGENP